MSRLFRDTGIIIDPHTAVGLAAAQREQARTGGPMVVLSTAHPAKFPDAVKRAIGREPEVPAALLRCLEGRERFELLPNSAAAVAAYIDARAPSASPSSPQPSPSKLALASLPPLLPHPQADGEREAQAPSVPIALACESDDVETQARQGVPAGGETE